MVSLRTTSRSKVEPIVVSSYVSAPEQGQFDANPIPSTSRLPLEAGTKFLTMTGQPGGKRGQAEAELDEGGDEDGDDDSEGDEGSKPVKNSKKRNATSTGRRKIAISYIDDKSKRHVSFTKRKAGLMKKAYELSTLTGTQVLVVVISETGLVYNYSTKLLNPIVSAPQGRAMIQAALRGDLDQDAADGEMVDAISTGYKSHELGAGPPAEDYGTIPFASIFVPSPLPGSTPIAAPPRRPSPLSALAPPILPASNFTLAQPKLFSHPTESYDPNVPTPYERAAEEHRQAFANYQKRYVDALHSSPDPLTSNLNRPPYPVNGTSQSSTPDMNAASRAIAARPNVYGFHSFGEAARTWKVTGLVGSTDRESVRTNLDLEGRAGGSGLGGGPIKPTGMMMEGGMLAAVGELKAMEDKRETLLEEAARALRDAYGGPISALIRAHSTSLRSRMPVLPPLLGGSTPSLPALSSIEQTLHHFGKVAQALGVSRMEDYQIAITEYFEKWLPAQTTADYRSIAVGKTHLTNHFDFLEANDLMPHFLIQAINLSPSTPAIDDDPTAERTREVRLEMAKCVEAAGKRYARSWGPGEMDGWFEVLNIGVNYVILVVSSEDDSQTDRKEPFKARIDPVLLSLLQVSDRLNLILRLPTSSRSWIPTASYGLHLSPPLSPPSSPIPSSPISSHESTIIRLQSLPLDTSSGSGTMQEQTQARERAVEYHIERVRLLKIARELMEEGEVSEEEEDYLV